MKTETSAMKAPTILEPWKESGTGFVAGLNEQLYVIRRQGGRDRGHVLA
jgi:hypothetical protein